MTVFDVIEAFMDEFANVEVGEIIDTNDVTLEIRNHDSGCLITVSVEKLPEEEMH